MLTQQPAADMLPLGERSVVPLPVACQGRAGETKMKTINVDHLPEPVVRAMEAVVKTLREQFRVEGKDSVDAAKVKAAILARRNASRTLNRDWEIPDQETWATDRNTHD